MPADLTRAAAQLAGLLRSVAAPRAAPAGALVLAYHDVSADESAAAPYTVSAADLAAHLDLLVASGYRLVDLDTVVRAHADGHGLDRLAALTFDDGYRGFAATAAPLLVDRGAPATVFCCSDLLGVAPWWSETAEPLADADQVRALAQLPGISVGAHGRHHVALASLDDGGQRDQVAGCRSRLEDLLGQPVHYFAYPYGSYDRRSPGIAAAAGFRASFTFANGRVTAASSVHLLPRLVMHDGQRGRRLRYSLARSDRSFAVQSDVVLATGLANVHPGQGCP